MASSLLLAPVAWLLYRNVGLPHSFATGEVGILVAEAPNQTSPDQQIAYQNTLRAYIQNSPELRDVAKVRLIERPLPADSEAAQAEATKIGSWLQASFVLRPYVVGGFQEPWLTVVKSSYLFIPESRLENIPTSQLAQLYSLPLPREVGLVAKIAVALALSEQQSYTKAAKILQVIIQSASTSAHREHIILGLCIFCMLPTWIFVVANYSWLSPSTKRLSDSNPTFPRPTTIWATRWT
jgi:hypothetical protein